ncbi:MAG TPA: hypothetical protein VNE38_16060 [Ktedonobacteraceae bacterium]|nr:hypothetical protein [Ktedonobacteraceae bacterium]
MDFMRMLTANFWTMVVLLLFVTETDLPLPKEPSWAEQSQTSYQIGYQQQG